MAKKYFVYHFAPTPVTPRWHYGFFSIDMKTEELPDIRYYQPKWIYNDETRTFVVIEPGQLYVKK
ncbi:hypothetical protein Q9L58_005185 [Maublancomyces gigas]|uniref:Uncharacterized protein n=1 Tax=Discina gigas TaxID=1032678 RepID=A0ABR3GIT3_9PEZI